MSAGRLIAVVGPSGVGKDSIIAGLCAADPDIAWVRRVITRPPEPEGENHVSVSEAAFAERAARGEFCLHWQAHGLSYGIPAQVCDDIEAGKSRIVNLSRAAIADAAERFANLIVLEITADPDILAARLHGRGRETRDEIAARLARRSAGFPDGVRVEKVENNGALQEAVAAALTAIQPVSATR